MTGHGVGVPRDLVFIEESLTRRAYRVQGDEGHRLKRLASPRVGGEASSAVSAAFGQPGQVRYLARV
jgi:hypothetical protein